MTLSFERQHKLKNYLVGCESFQIWNFQIVILFKAHGIYEQVNKEKKLENLTRDAEKAD